MGRHTSDRLIIAVLIGPLTVVGWAARAIDTHLLRFGPSEFVLLAIVVAVACWIAWSAGSKLRERRNYLDGISAERATAQAFVQLLSKGCAVYHDIPADGFNLDHVVVGPTTVFMIETKSRRKPATGGKASATVKFDGKILEFPDWHDTKMLDQTRRQTRWLSELLYCKTGERVPVEAVLALPGWYVTCSAPSPDVHVINPKMCNFMTTSKGVLIHEPQRRRIMTAIEECYSYSGG